MMDLVVCDACGAIVSRNMKKVHSDWHDLLVTKDGESKDPLANPKRTQS